MTQNSYCPTRCWGDAGWQTEFGSSTNLVRPRKIGTKSGTADRKTANAQRRLRIIRRYAKRPCRMLVVGFGDTVFPAVAREKGWQVTSLNVPGGESGETPPDVSTIEAGAFDVVAIWDVLQKVPNPEESLETLTRGLKDKGLLMLSVPNAAFRRTLPKEHELAGHSGEADVNDFDRQTLGETLESAGFERIMVFRTLPSPAFPDWLQNKEQAARPRSLGGGAANGRLARLRWRILRSAGWVSNTIRRPDVDPFTTLEAIAFKP
jgi:Methyltransferase domain